MLAIDTVYQKTLLNKRRGSFVLCSRCMDKLFVWTPCLKGGRQGEQSLFPIRQVFRLLIKPLNAHTHTWMCYSASIPAGFTQCRWSTSRETSSPLQCEQSTSSIPPPPPHHRTPGLLLSRITWNGGIIWKPSLCFLNPVYLLLLFFLPTPLLLAPSPPMSSQWRSCCPLRGGGGSVTLRFVPSSYDTRWHSHGCHHLHHSLDQVTRWSPPPASFSHILTTHKNKTHTNLDQTNQMVFWSNTTCQAHAFLSWELCWLGCWPGGEQTVCYLEHNYQLNAFYQVNVKYR